MKHKGGALLGAVLAGAVAAMPVHAACWSGDAAEATQIRNLQTRLMVATLKCQTAGIDITATYNDFVRARRGTLAAANVRIKNHFADAAGNSMEAQAGYDRFVTSLANAYGADETNAGTCAAAAAQAMDAADEGADLLRISAEGASGMHTLSVGLCTPASGPVRIAAAEPAVATPVATTVAAAAKPGAPGPALTSAASTRPPLPAEVVTAMAVIAAFAREQSGAPGTTGTTPPIDTASIGATASR